MGILSKKEMLVKNHPCAKFTPPLLVVWDAARRNMRRPSGCCRSITSLEGCGGGEHGNIGSLTTSFGASLEVNHHFEHGGSFWMMIFAPTKVIVVQKPTYKKWWSRTSRDLFFLWNICVSQGCFVFLDMT